MLIDESMIKSRREKLGRFFSDFQLDAIIFSNLDNIRYLSGFTGSAGLLIITTDLDCYLLCDSRYTAQATAETVSADVRQFSDKLNAVKDIVSERNLLCLGVEAQYITLIDFTALTDKLSCCEFVSLNNDLDSIRAIKDSFEIDELTEVAQLSSEAFLDVINCLVPGCSEASFAFELEFAMRKRGAQGRAFDFIVASGERGAMPHGRATDKKICSGELITVDFGAVRNGYNSDETITVAVGRPDQRYLDIYNVVKEAHDRAVKAVKPGMLCRDMDAVARKYIAECGYGEYFGHGLGHGVGLQVHENPVVSPRGDMVLEEGMVFTIEPGIYISGLGGVRIEDTVTVQADGCKLLTQVPKDLMIL